MEKPTDAYKETHNLVLASKNTYTGGQVSSLQVSSFDIIYFGFLAIFITAQGTCITFGYVTRILLIDVKYSPNQMLS